MTVPVKRVLAVDRALMKTTIEEDERQRSRRLEDAREIDSPHENESGSENPVPV